MLLEQSQIHLKPIILGILNHTCMDCRYRDCIHMQAGRLAFFLAVALQAAMNPKVVNLKREGILTFSY
jgi:hypothetical protein